MVCKLLVWFLNGAPFFDYLFPFHVSRNQFPDTKCVYWFHIVNCFPNWEYTAFKCLCYVILSIRKIIKSAGSWKAYEIENSRILYTLSLLCGKENYRLALAPKPLEYWIWQRIAPRGLLYYKRAVPPFKLTQMKLPVYENHTQCIKKLSGDMQFKENIGVFVIREKDRGFSVIIRVLLLLCASFGSLLTQLNW